MSDRTPTRFCRFGLSIALALGLMSGVALAGDNHGHPVLGASGGMASADPRGFLEAGGKIDARQKTLCTWATCGPQRADSPWTLAGFGLAAGAAAWLGRRPRQK